MNPAPPRPPPASAALADLLAALRLWPLWCGAGLEDIRGRYRRTLLGPLWLTLGTGLAVGGMGLVWGVLLGQPLRAYFPYMTAGLVTWGFLSGVMVESCTVFVHAAGLLRAVPLPLFVHPLRLVTRHVVVYLHNLAAFVVVALLCGVPLDASLLLWLPAMLLLIANATWIALLLGMLGARYRDLAPLVAAASGVMFLLTPALWRPEMLGPQRLIATMNPFAHALDLARLPLLGLPPDGSSWLVVAAAGVAGWTITFLLFRRCRGAVVLWA